VGGGSRRWKRSRFNVAIALKENFGPSGRKILTSGRAIGPTAQAMCLVTVYLDREEDSSAGCERRSDVVKARHGPMGIMAVLYVDVAEKGQAAIRSAIPDNCGAQGQGLARNGNREWARGGGKWISPSIIGIEVWP